MATLTRTLINLVLCRLIDRSMDGWIDPPAPRLTCSSSFCHPRGPPQIRDENCVARGKCWKKNCSACPNGPTQQEEVILTAEVQKGMRDRDTIVFEEVADEALGHLAGHLVFIIETLVHPDFTRRNDDLHMEMEIPLLQALVRDCLAAKAVLFFFHQLCGQYIPTFSSPHLCPFLVAPHAPVSPVFQPRSSIWTGVQWR